MRRAIRRLAQWLIRLLLRVGLLPASTRTTSDTMGEWEALQAEKDDPKPGLVLPEPNAPHAELIRRVRLYAQNGAKALGPLLDGPLLDDDEFVCERCDAAEEALPIGADADGEAEEILLALKDHGWRVDAVRAVHAAYNSPWTVIDGEVYEYESETKRRVVQ